MTDKQHRLTIIEALAPRKAPAKAPTKDPGGWKTVSVRIRTADYASLEAAAAGRSQSISDFVREAIATRLRRKG